MNRQITRSELKKIIKEEIQKFLTCGGAGSGQSLTSDEIKKRRKQRDKSDDDRRRKINYMGGRDMVDLAKGHITEDPAGDCVGNHNHDKDGRWTNPDDAASWTRLDKDCEKSGQYSKRFKGTSHAPCGSIGDVKCKDGSLKEDEAKDDYLDILYKYEALQKKFVELQKLARQLKSRKTPGGMDLDTCVKTINSIVQSTKGDFGKKDK